MFVQLLSFVRNSFISLFGDTKLIKYFIVKMANLRTQMIRYIIQEAIGSKWTMDARGQWKQEDNGSKWTMEAS